MNDPTTTSLTMRGALTPAILIPVYNHAGTIQRVLVQLKSALASANLAKIPILVVDDGSTDGGGESLAAEGITLLRHKKNRGKGAALRTGMAHAAAHGITHVITMDADGQHAADDVVKVLREAEAHPNDLIIGQRDMNAPGVSVPLRSRKGRDASRFWLRIQTGQEIPDSQCGLRAYPIAFVLALPQRFHRYDFETEILARLAWSGVRIRSVPITCIYFGKEHRVSHFRPLRDSLRGVRVNFFLVVRRLLPIPFPRLGSGDDLQAAAFGRWWKWSTWRLAIRDSLRAGSSNSELAMAFGMGIFIGLTPFYLVQTLLAIYFARRLHLNIVAAVLGSQISIPPLAPVWLTLSYAVGNLLLRGEWVLADMQVFTQRWNQETMASRVWLFLLGNFLVAMACAMIGLLVARAFLFCVRRSPAAVAVHS